MRNLPVTPSIAILIGLTIGCSNKPDLTPEQLSALQTLGELQKKPDPDRVRWEEAQDALSARCRSHSDDPDAEWTMTMVYSCLGSEFHSRRVEHGIKTAADWYIAELKKSDKQLMAEWGTIEALEESLK